MHVRTLPVTTLLALIGPPLLTIGFVLTVFADSGLVLDGIVRPLVAATLLAVTVQTLSIAVVRDVRGGSAIAFGLVGGVIHPLLLVTAITAGILWYAIRRSRAFPAEGLGVIALVVFVISLDRAVTSPAFDLADLGFQPATTRGVSVSGDPDIHLVWLDGYARSDTLADFGYDNTWFQDALAERGFNVASEAHSNYSYTSQVMASMLHMAHLDEIVASAPKDNRRQYRAIVGAISDNPVINRLHERGYRVVSTGVPGSVSELRGADEYLESAQLSNFEHQVLARTSLWGALRDAFALPQHRDQILGTFAQLRTVAAEPSDQPTFMLTHVLSPHTPLAFDRDGAMPTLSCGKECRPFQIHDAELGISTEEFGRAYGDQTHYINKLVLEAVDTITGASPDAVVVVLSDHGARHDQSVNAEWFRSFFAARTPGQDDVFGEDARPIEIFPRLFNAYFRDSHPIPADRTYQAVSGGLLNPLEVAPWPPSTPLDPAVDDPP